MKKILLAPSILSANFSNLEKEIIEVMSSGADIIHFDVMDNHYVPNLTFGSMVLKSLRKSNIKSRIDVHLMARPLENLIHDFLRAGADSIFFHPECSDHIDKTLNTIKDYGCQTGLVFNPATSLCCLEHVIEKVDNIVLMGVNPGFGGQTFISSTISKIKKVRSIITNSKLKILLHIDGGVNLKNIADISRAGSDVFIVGSTVFESKNYFSILKKLRDQANNI